MNYGFPQSSDTGYSYNFCPQYSDATNQPVQRRRESKFHGLVIGIHPVTGYYLVYSCIYPDLVKIRRTVPILKVGSWVKIYVNCEDFNADFILDESNSRGYSGAEQLPDPKYTFARFFPESRDDISRGEVLVAARFVVRLNREKNQMELETYDIGSVLIDDYNLIKKSSPYYEGRNFIVEAQASLEGFCIVAVHEDPHNQLRCDELDRTVVPYNARLLNDTPLMAIMTKDGYAPEYQPSTSQQSSLQNQNQCSSSHHNTQAFSKAFSTSSSFSQGQLAELQSETEPELQNIRYNTTANTTLSYFTANEKLPGAREPPVEKESSESDLEDESRLVTRGTSNFPPKEYLKDLGRKALERFKTELGMRDDSVTTALCTVVQKIDGGAILYTAKQQVLNVLALESSCEGLDRPLELGDVAFFEISARRIYTKDELLPKVPYSHIAMRKKPVTAESRVKIDRFKKSVRTFGGLLEMKVEIPLMTAGREGIIERCDSGPTKDGGVYCMVATNGVLVSIPRERLIQHLDGDWKASFDLVAWAVYRRDYANVCLHLGLFGEVYGRDKNGCYRELSDAELVNTSK